MGISTFTSKEFVIFCRVSKIGNVNRQLPFALFDSGRRFPASVWMTLLVIRMVVKTRFGRQLVVWTTPKSMPRNGDCRSTLYIYIWHLLFYERPIYLSNPVAWYLRFQRKVFGVISSLTTALCWCSSDFMSCLYGLWYFGCRSELAAWKGSRLVSVRFAVLWCSNMARTTAWARRKLPHRLPGWDMVG